MHIRRAVAVLLSTVLAGGAVSSPAGAGPSSHGDSGLPGRHSLRAPVTDENFYFVMADRFDNGSPANDRGGLGDDPLVSGFDPTRKGFYNGGDLAGLLRRIDYVRGLGTTSIWLTPSFKNKAVQLEDGPPSTPVHRRRGRTGHRHVVRAPGKAPDSREPPRDHRPPR